MKAPDFLVVGAARAGTTSLHYYLRQHPQLFIPSRKEPCFFSFAGELPNYKKGRFSFALSSPEKYFRLFSDAGKEQICGEVSTPYLYLYEKTISNIRKYHPDPESLKILILLRNPVDRAYSQYMWRVRDGREELTFEEAIKQEAERMRQGYSFDYFYVHRGMYFEQVKAYMDAFKSVKVVLLDDIIKDREGMLRVICRFLGVDDTMIFQNDKVQNKSYSPRWNFLSRIVTSESRLKFHLLNQVPDNWKKSIRHQFDRWNSDRSLPQPLRSETRKYLASVYHDDLMNLQDLIGRNLSSWMKQEAEE